MSPPRSRSRSWASIRTTGPSSSTLPLLAYCTERRITFTRSRPGNKNDGAHVEQKNWARVRELVGYLRYDTEAELATLNEIWELDRIFTNYLLPQQKLVSKERRGAKVVKKHDAPATPHQRAIGHKDMRKRPAVTMNAVFKRIKPGELSRRILALTAELETLALAKKPAPVRKINTAWNPGLPKVFRRGNADPEAEVSK